MGRHREGRQEKSLRIESTIMDDSDKSIFSALFSWPLQLLFGIRQSTDTFISKIYDFVMAAMNGKLKQRNPQEVTSNQEITDKSVLPSCS